MSLPKIQVHEGSTQWFVFDKSAQGSQIIKTFPRKTGYLEAAEKAKALAIGDENRYSIHWNDDSPMKGNVYIYTFDGKDWDYELVENKFEIGGSVFMEELAGIEK